VWNDPSEKIEGAIAKATYVKTKKVWKIYWQRQDLKWHGYQPKPEVKTVEEFLDVVDLDDHACFFSSCCYCMFYLNTRLLLSF